MQDINAIQESPSYSTLALSHPLGWRTEWRGINKFQLGQSIIIHTKDDCGVPP